MHNIRILLWKHIYNLEYINILILNVLYVLIDILIQLLFI